MRKLDELLQDIPLERLIPPEQEDTGAAEDTSVSRRDNSFSGRSVSAVRSRFSIAAVVLAAVTAAVVLAVCIKQNHSAGTDPDPLPAGQVSGTAESIDSTASTESSDITASSGEETSSERSILIIDSAAADGDAKALYNGMQRYMQEYPELCTDFGDVLYVRMNDIDGVNGETGIRLRMMLDREFDGTAVFIFRNGVLKYTEFATDDPGSMVEIYPEFNGKSKVTALGRIQGDLEDPDPDSKTEVMLEVDINGITARRYADISELPWLTEWYEEFRKTAPEPVTYGDGKLLMMPKPNLSYDGYVSAEFRDETGTVTVTSSDDPAGNAAVNRLYYNLQDISVFDRIREFVTSS